MVKDNQIHSIGTHNHKVVSPRRSTKSKPRERGMMFFSQATFSEVENITLMNFRMNIAERNLSSQFIIADNYGNDTVFHQFLLGAYRENNCKNYYIIVMCVDLFEQNCV